jgi:hypothetical protein
MSVSLSICLLAAAFTAVVCKWEWQGLPADRRRFRIGAVVALGAALALLGLASLAPASSSVAEGRPAILVTEGAGPIPATGGAFFDLGTAPSGDSALTLVPDAAFVRRLSPHVSEFQIAGSGVTAADAVALSGQRVRRMGEIRPSSVPLFETVTSPRDVVLGDAVKVQGRVFGLAPATPVTVALEAPDGTVRTAEVQPEPDGRGLFAVAGGVPVAPGSFEWRLRIGSRGDAVTLGVTVSPAKHPRILFWESAPSAESARLRRWLGEMGPAVSGRVQVSADRVRTTGSDVTDGRTLAAELLAAQDVLVCDSVAFAQFTPAELTVLRRAVRDDGLGLLVMAGALPLAERTEFPLPWMLVTDPTAGEESTRRSRLRLFDGTRLEEPVGVLSATLAEGAFGRRLATDTLDRAVVTRFAEGRGSVTVSLVQDSWRWLQQGQEQAYARFWTLLLSSLGRPVPAELPWRMLEADSPCFVDQPVRLAYVGADDRPPSWPVVFSPESVKPVTLASGGPREALFWPRSPGWHHLESASGGQRQSFYVQPAQALSGVRGAMRNRLTARLVVDSALGSFPEAAEVSRPDRLAYVSWLVLLGALAGLWIEERWRRRV